MRTTSVLIVEDEATLREVYEMILTRQAYRVETAANGLLGLQALRKGRFDIVLLDIFMPVMDGKEFLRNIDVADYPETTIVVCSNLSDKETEQEILTLGADRFVLKSSLAPRELVQLVKDLTDR